METSCDDNKTPIIINGDSYSGCQAIIRENEKCGEIKSLDILKEFQQLYERKISEIEEDCNCPATKAKNQILKDWVNDLTEQNTLLVQVVEELEHEASERVALLEDKLKHSSKTSFEIMQTLQDYDAQNISNQSDFIKKIMNYQSDINNLVEFIRRIRVEGQFNFEGLHFYNVASDDIYSYGDVVPRSVKNDQKEKDLEGIIDKLNMELKMYKDKQKEYDQEKKNRDKILIEQNDKIDRLSDVVDRCSVNMPDRQKLLEELHELRNELKSRNEDFGRLELFEHGDNCKEYQTFKIQITGLEEQNCILRQTISNANAELNELRGVVEKYNVNQYTPNTYNYSDTLLLLRTANTSESLGTDNGSQDSDNDFNRTMYLLKAEINKMVRLVSEQTINVFKSNVDDVATTMNDLTNKDKLLKNKDEMIKIQNDSLVLAQEELKTYQDKVYELEKDREIKMQEIKNLKHALVLNQSSIEELKNTLRNCEEKGTNTQQTADMYLETIQMLENAKHKAENEVEQQRITIGNLQEALVNVKQQLEGVQNRNTSELKEKSDIIYALYLNLSEMQTQYMDCYEEAMKLTQTAECLRNSNLDLKVINTDLEKDIFELNIQLAKSKDTIQALEENIKKILSTNEILEDDITFMNTEMKEVSKELKILQKLLKKNDSSSNETMTLTKSIQILQDHSESLVEQLKLAQDQVSREIGVNQTSSLQILDLQKQLEIKTIELQRTEIELRETKSKLTISTRRIQDFEKRCSYLEKQLNEVHILNKSNEQKTEEIINSDISCLKQKIDMLSKVLNEKSAEILKLHSDLSSKSDTLSKIIADNTQLQENNTKMAVNVMNLEKQLCLYKTRCEEINSKYLICQSELETLKVITSSQEDIKKDRTVLVAKLETIRKEENKLNKIINELKQELEETKYTIKQKDEDLNSLTSIQQEVLPLKEEINRLTKMRNKLITENQKLQEQINKLSLNATQYENRHIHLSEQLEKCVEELNNLQNIKAKIEERNIHLETEIGHLQRVFGELNQEIRYKQESVINLEHELTETKCSRDEICAESRIVVNNVRAWLEEHKRINISLNNTVKEKNMIIEELTLERNLLLKNIKEVCERYETLTEELHICRQYLSELNPDEKAFSKGAIKNPFKRSVHTWGSQGSNSYDSNSPVILEPDYDYSSFVEDEQPTQDNWMQKINDLSVDIQKSKKYWKRRLSSTKRGDNKIDLKYTSSTKTN